MDCCACTLSLTLPSIVDKNHDSNISLVELREFMSTLDLDHDGIVARDDFVGAGNFGELKEAEALIFNQFDPDGHGEIEIDHDFIARWKAVDENGDGSLWGGNMGG